MITEIELKFDIPASEIESFQQSELLDRCAQSQPQSQQIMNWYYDTPALGLTHSGYAMRIRELDGQYQQTIKDAGEVKEGLHQRQEWEHQLAMPQPELTVLPKALAGELKPYWSQLEIVFEVVFKRITWQLVLPESTLVEVALDQGKVTMQTKQDMISEVELELKQGEKSQLLRFAEQLQNEFNLVPSNISKAERGYQLLKESADAD